MRVVADLLPKEANINVEAAEGSPVGTPNALVIPSSPTAVRYWRPRS